MCAGSFVLILAVVESNPESRIVMTKKSINSASSPANQFRDPCRRRRYSRNEKREKKKKIEGLFSSAVVAPPPLFSSLFDQGGPNYESRRRGEYKKAACSTTRHSVMRAQPVIKRLHLQQKSFFNHSLSE